MAYPASETRWTSKRCHHSGPEKDSVVAELRVHCALDLDRLSPLLPLPIRRSGTHTSIERSAFEHVHSLAQRARNGMANTIIAIAVTVILIFPYVFSKSEATFDLIRIPLGVLTYSRLICIVLRNFANQL